MLRPLSSPDSYLQDASGYRGQALHVFAPANLEELAELVATCSSQRIPVTVSGAGTGLTGARVPHGGYVVSLERFRRLEIESGRARCGAGVSLRELQKAAAATHQFFGPNPTENTAVVGGIFSTNAGGARSFQFRSVRFNSLAVEVMFLDGRVERFTQADKIEFTGDNVRVPETTKNSAGYYLQRGASWVDLLAGSEGTLGIVTGVELLLQPDPPSTLGAVIFFRSDENALDAADRWRGISQLHSLEFMDGYALDLLRPGYPSIPPTAGAALLIEQGLFGRDDEELEEWSARLEEAHALTDDSWFGSEPKEGERFRQFRHTLPALVTETARRSGFSKFGTDFAVPLAVYRELHAYYKTRCAEVVPGKFTIFGHVGDANCHVNLIPANIEEARRGERLIEDFARKVISLEGTVAAEHGIGKNKTDLLELMYSEGEIESMRAFKRKLDPDWLLGQGTIFRL